MLTSCIVKGIRGNSKEMLQRAIEIVEKHNLHPLIGKVYEWQDAPKGFETLREGTFVGKLVIKV
jgi:NADPH:quinone reductase-like Zn-dependent oxidoreductase